jgi:hypothetical protein
MIQQLKPEVSCLVFCVCSIAFLDGRELIGQDYPAFRFSPLINPRDAVGHAISPAERPRETSISLPENLDELTALDKSSTTDHEKLESWLRWAILTNLPPSYEDNRRWGLEKSVYDGFRFRREGLKIETERKYETVKHGTWSRYYLEFDEPEKNLRVTIPRFDTDGGERLLMNATIELPLHAFGRVSQWQRDIQLISLSMNADATVRLNVATETKVRVNPLVFPPEVVFEPVVKDAKLELLSFEVHRISQLHGPLAEELGKDLKRILDDRMADFSDKLVEKMNRQLDKQKDKFRLSLAKEIPDWLSPILDQTKSQPRP